MCSDTTKEKGKEKKKRILKCRECGGLSRHVLLGPRPQRTHRRAHARGHLHLLLRLPLPAHPAHFALYVPIGHVVRTLGEVPPMAGAHLVVLHYLARRWVHRGEGLQRRGLQMERQEEQLGRRAVLAVLYAHPPHVHFVGAAQLLGGICMLCVRSCMKCFSPRVTKASRLNCLKWHPIIAYQWCQMAS